jgi:hypothetical protein
MLLSACLLAAAGFLRVEVAAIPFPLQSCWWSCPLPTTCRQSAAGLANCQPFSTLSRRGEAWLVKVFAQGLS